MISVSGFHSQKIIHQGEMSLVSTAVREHDNLTVVLKYPRPETASIDEITRYHKEFDTLSRVQSDRIIAVLDVIEQDGLPVLVMEHFAHSSLSERLSHYTDRKYRKGFRRNTRL